MSNMPADLTTLADIQEPMLANDWYTAPGWWLLLLILLILLWFLAKRRRKYQQQQAPIQAALQQLQQIDLSQQEAVAAITTLLKQRIISAKAKHPALTLSGQAWQTYLLASLPTNKHALTNLPDLLQLHYEKNPPSEAIVAYAAFAKIWLQHANMEQGITHV